jgi:hypothetical protein
MKPVQQSISRNTPAAKSDWIEIGHQVVSLEESGRMMTGISDWCDLNDLADSMQRRKKRQERRTSWETIKWPQWGEIVALIVKVQGYKRLYPFSAATR